MAEDTDTQADERAGEGRPKRRGLPPIVLVAVGAALGGAGVVFLVPKPAAVERHGPPAPEIFRIEHGDLIETSFNARKERGYAMAKVSFRFVYRLDIHHEQKVLASIQHNWNQMYSRVLLVLMQQSPEDLQSDEGIRHLTKRLTAEMSLTLFPNREAVVDDIVWKHVFVQ